MVNMHMMEIFRNLTKEDLKELGLFLYSEFNNRSHLKNDVQRLFEILKKAHPDFEPQKIEREKVINHLYPGTAPVKGKFDKVASELNKLTREYLLWKNYQSEKGAFDKSLDWLSILRDFSLDDRYEQFYMRIEKDFFLNRTFSPRYYFDRFLFNYEKHFWLSTHNTAKNDMNLFATLESLSMLYETFRLDLLNSFLTQQLVMKLKVPEGLQIYVNNIPSPASGQSNIILNISISIYNLLQKEVYSLEEFNEVMNTLQKDENKIDQSTLAEYYRYLRNLCTFLMDSDLRFQYLIPFLHELQKDNLQRGYLHIEGKMLATTYLSIPRMAIMADKVQWAEEFVENYQHEIIGTTDTKEYYLTCKALCHFAKKEYSAALNSLPAVCDNAVYYLLARRLEVMCYYNLRADNILGKLEAFKMLIRRASEKFLSPYLRDQNNAFANLLIQIILTPPGDKKRASIIAERIRKKKPVAESIWLLSIVRNWK